MKNEIVLLKNVVEEKDKAITKLKTKHSEEVKELKKQQIQTTENLRSTVMEREVLRENDRILLNTFDMMKQYIKQMKEQYSNNAVVDVGKYDKCQKCEYTAKTPTEIAQHMSTKHTDKYFSCERCKFVTETEKNLAEHIKNEHEAARFIKCKSCDFESESADNLREHERSHVKETLYECEVCQFDSIIRANIEAHMKTYHSPKSGAFHKRCINWNQGYCSLGMECNFSHEEIPACRYQERCKNSRCPFYHFNTSWNTFLGKVQVRGRQEKL